MRSNCQSCERINVGAAMSIRCQGRAEQNRCRSIPGWIRSFAAPCARGSKGPRATAAGAFQLMGSLHSRRSAPSPLRRILRQVRTAASAAVLQILLGVTLGTSPAHAGVSNAATNQSETKESLQPDIARMCISKNSVSRCLHL